MKAKKLIKAILVVVACVTLQSCGTILSSKRAEVILVNCPKDLKVTENGTELEIVQVLSHAKSRGRYETDLYYAAGVMVSKKEKNHTLTLESNGKKVEVKKRTKVSGGILFLDIIFFPIPAIPIDAVTKKWRIIRHRHIDVSAAINGTEPMSQRKLKKLVRKQAKANS